MHVTQKVSSKRKPKSENNFVQLREKQFEATILYKPVLGKTSRQFFMD
jgi:hypothetical protein